MWHLKCQEGVKKMAKKEYFQKNTPCAELLLTYNSLYVLYGVEYGVNDYAYIAYKHKGIIKSYHKLMIHYTAGGKAYINAHGRRLGLEEFCRI